MRMVEVKNGCKYFGEVRVVNGVGILILIFVLHR